MHKPGYVSSVRAFGSTVSGAGIGIANGIRLVDAGRDLTASANLLGSLHVARLTQFVERIKTSA